MPSTRKIKHPDKQGLYFALLYCPRDLFYYFLKWQNMTLTAISFHKSFISCFPISQCKYLTIKKGLCLRICCILSVKMYLQIIEHESVLNILKGLIVHIPTKSQNDEAFSKDRSDDWLGNYEGVWISPKDYTKTTSWKRDEWDGKPCSKWCWSTHILNRKTLLLYVNISQSDELRLEFRKSKHSSDE